MSEEEAKAAVLSVLKAACLQTEKGKAPGNARLVWMTVRKIAAAGNMSESVVTVGLRRGIQENLISEGTGDNKGKYALNDPKLNQLYTG